MIVGGFLGGCGRLWVVLDGCGWLWVVAFSITQMEVVIAT